MLRHLTAKGCSYSPDQGNSADQPASSIRIHGKRMFSGGRTYLMMMLFLPRYEHQNGPAQNLQPTGTSVSQLATTKQALKSNSSRWQFYFISFKAYSPEALRKFTQILIFRELFQPHLTHTLNPPSHHT